MATMSTTEPLISFRDVFFTFPAEEPVQVFSGLNIDVPAGITSLVGQNGTGKSTFLMLAAARLFPDSGSIHTLGRPTDEFRNAHLDPDREEERNQLFSIIYQNMEFETDAPIGDLFEYVYAEGPRQNAEPELLATIIQQLELSDELQYRTQELSKGALQRAVIAFSLLYGSPVVFMDEPVFALEDARKERVFGFLQEFTRSQNMSLLYSAHELHLSEKYSENVLLFYKNGRIDVGPTAEMLARDRIEAAYQVPMVLLNKKERLYREVLQKSAGQ